MQKRTTDGRRWTRLKYHAPLVRAIGEAPLLLPPNVVTGRVQAAPIFVLANRNPFEPAADWLQDGAS